MYDIKGISHFFKEDFVGWLRWLLVLIYIPGLSVLPPSAA